MSFHLIFHEERFLLFISGYDEQLKGFIPASVMHKALWDWSKALRVWPTPFFPYCPVAVFPYKVNLSFSFLKVGPDRRKIGHQRALQWFQLFPSTIRVLFGPKEQQPVQCLHQSCPVVAVPRLSFSQPPLALPPWVFSEVTHWEPASQTDSGAAVRVYVSVLLRLCFLS